MKKLLTIPTAALAGAALALGAMAPAHAATKLPTPVTTCEGVWVTVDTGSATTTQCATAYTSGLEALKSTGLAVKLDPQWGMTCQIAGYPATCPGSDGYWAYFHATRQADGTWGAWQYAQEGAADYKPAKGSAEGWRYTSLEGNATTPSTYPPKAFKAALSVTVKGKAKAGATLKAVAKSTPKAAYRYQWTADGKAIKGATKATYTVKKSDKGAKLAVTVKATKKGYATTTATSRATRAK
jgi:hypothetical protein